MSGHFFFLPLHEPQTQLHWRTRTHSPTCFAFVYWKSRWTKCQTKLFTSFQHSHSCFQLALACSPLSSLLEKWQPANLLINDYAFKGAPKAKRGARSCAHVLKDVSHIHFYTWGLWHGFPTFLKDYPEILSTYFSRFERTSSSRK